MTKLGVYSLLAAAVLAVGCAKEQEAARVAVLDLDTLAVALGWNVEFEEALRRKERSLSDQLRQMQANLQQQLEDTQKEFGETPAPEQQQQLIEMSQQAGRLYQDAMNNARQQGAQLRTELITEFRNKVRPYATEAAREGGYAIVLLKADPVYYVDPLADLTSAVSSKMQNVNWQTADSDTTPESPATGPSDTPPADGE